MQSFISYAPESHFPLQNIPFGVFTTSNRPTARVGTRVGDTVVDLSVLAEAGLFKIELPPTSQDVFAKPSLNAFMALGRPIWRAVRKRLQELLSVGPGSLSDPRWKQICETALVPYQQAVMKLPAEIGDYTDFYASKEHATNVGIMFRGKENALMPNWTHLPVGYHGRASSIVASGTDIRRPCGQRNAAPKGEAPNVVFGPSVRMDFELEMAFLVGVGNELGDRIPIQEADEHVFGVVLMNDWSARDIQAWEYVPLGPFLGKNFGTTISAWVVTLDALAPFLVEAPPQEPSPLPYLKDPETRSAYDVHLEVSVKSQKQNEFAPISRTNLKYMYWSIRQQIAHHTVNGCNLRPGDLLATGTISGPTPDSYGSMLELSWSGTKSISIGGGEERKFLEDGDELRLVGWAQGDGYRVGFGECTGTILPARP